ncbi:tumor necrosis factor receptor superfamily member 13C-like isoform X2 [Colossoma macropomum]|uniref:tumor necrosis factor receptor superfamily member 13C-like isoform X2 n=1 Tax=Colossoma macropomum TaxID=42526 RepID=UPI001863B6D7|nr:tumor necrosis factor receptor superfamily member 13C-like isoform X2 [Colossoma macropomum]
MDKKTCGPGFSWDGLVKDCIQETQPVTVDTLAVMRTNAPTSSWTAFAPSVWICVGVILSSLVLALLLWFIIYRRHTHNTGKRRSEPAAPPQLNGNTVSPALLEEREDPSLSCPHWNGKTEEVSVCEMGWGRGICEGKMEHGVPVPATELGDSALVTTKTVQQAEA